jgi:hypothetical protein
MYTISSMNLYATSKAAFWCWGMFLSALALGCRAIWSPQDLGCGSAWQDGAW